jgi:hypothetical protein
MKFKIGDKVKRTLNDWWWKDTGLDFSKHYEITSVRDVKINNKQCITLKGSDSLFDGGCFELAFTIEDQVKRAFMLKGKSQEIW